MPKVSNKEPDVFLGSHSLDDKSLLALINLVRRGIDYTYFESLSNRFLFNLSDWSTYLHTSERTLQRHKQEKRVFDSVTSEKILLIAILYNTGVEVFGDINRFETWLDSTNLALGKVKPKDLLDNSFGISMVKDELTRIEHGILA